MLECVINVSEGQEGPELRAIVEAGGRSVLDVHRDEHHNRAVLTMAGTDVEDAARTVAAAAVLRLDLRTHHGVHPRIGVVDVVPFVPLDGSMMDDALAARDRFAAWAGSELQLPCFLYGPERSLPEVRRGAFKDVAPDRGPSQPHPTAGACAVGARDVLVAYNLWLDAVGLDTVRPIAARLRGPVVRTLALDVGGRSQLSMNLIAPHVVGPAEVYDLVARLLPIGRAELVGLVPRSVLAAIPEDRWPELDLSAERTIEARLTAAGR